MRGWIRRSQFLLVLASAVILRSEAHRIHDQILLSHIRASPKSGGPGPRIYISQLCPQALGSLSVAFYDSQCTDHIANLFNYCRDAYMTQLPSNQPRRLLL
jgi:hypothetical protein